MKNRSTSAKAAQLQKCSQNRCTAYQCEFYRRGLLGDVHLQREATPENVCGRTKGNTKVYSQIKALCRTTQLPAVQIRLLDGI